MRYSRFVTRVVMVAAALGLVMLPQASAQASSHEVVIGVPLSVSGPAGEYGRQQRIATDMAVEDINAAGGIKGKKLRVIHYDDASKPDECINVVRRLIERDKVFALAGPLLSSCTLVTFPIANRAQVPIVSSASSAPGIGAKNRPWAFRNTTLEADSAWPALEYWVKKNKIKSVAIFVDNKDIVSKANGTIVVPSLLKILNVELLDTVSFQSGNVDFSAHVTKVKQLNPGGIVIAALQNEGAGVAREVRRQGMQQSFWGPQPLAVPTFIELGGKATEGTIIAAGLWLDSPDPKIAAWVKRYVDLDPFHRRPHFVAIFQYETMWIYKNCIEKSGATLDPKDLESDRVKVRDCWQNLKDHPVLSGTMSINEDGDGKRKALILEVRNGKFEIVNP
ncbi:MAG: ABC transporter substrate-binding protein [Candidatus Tectomicrobia bacterium]|nr:ABC transporter substrate-binding protein [Candidatus Tectomicrobia bacterium]